VGCFWVESDSKQLWESTPDVQVDHFLHLTCNLGIPVEMVQLRLKFFFETGISCCAPRFPLILTVFIPFMLRSRSRNSEILERSETVSEILERSDVLLQLHNPALLNQDSFKSFTRVLAGTITKKDYYYHIIYYTSQLKAGRFL